MERTQRLVKNALLAFVLVSIGFVLGKNSARPRTPAPVQPPPTDAKGLVAAGEIPLTIRVYYLHATFRCVTCNTIEKMTRDLLEQRFGEALADGRLEWQEADFQENKNLAMQFNVITSCVVVAKMRGQTVLDYRRLDQVWELLKDGPRFNTYVGDAIRGYLPEVGGGGTP
jgi:hypothetical protein